MTVQIINEWEHEPNFLEFIDDSTGYKCFIVRHTTSGHLCGYVQIPKEHKLNIKEIEELEIDVHGGVTYAEEKEAIRIGFDCAHSEDLFPYLDKNNPNVKYRNIEYVTNECKKLAKQLKMYE